jgi:thiopurine S-methyltransferase
VHEEWLARWRDGRTGFHEGHPNRYLTAHAARLAGARRVLVPLCGKTEDLAFLARTHEVVGVELAAQAVEAFFAEHGLAPTIERRGAFEAYRAGAITILVGDVLATTAEVVGPVDALYDRAALIALPPEVRVAYARQVRGLISAGATGLVVTLEYDQTRMSGPPFSVPEAEVRALYPGLAVEQLDEGPARSGGKCAETGTTAIERCFAVRF